MSTRAPRSLFLAAAGLAVAGVVSACGSSSGTAADPGDSSAPATASSAPASTAPATTPSSSDPSAPADDTNVLIRVDAPSDGATVSGSLKASGVANSPEANVPWTITAADGHVVKKGHATAEGWMDKAYPWKKTIDVSDLAAGSYTFTARIDDESDGESTPGPQPTSDSVTFTVS